MWSLDAVLTPTRIDHNADSACWSAISEPFETFPRELAHLGVSGAPGYRPASSVFDRLGDRV